MEKVQKRWLEGFFPALLVVQLLVLAVIVWTAPQDLIMDYDAAKVYGNVMAMRQAKRLILPGWDYLTTMELDCATLLLLPLYALCGDIFLAVKLSSVMLPLLWTAVILALCARLGQPRRVGCLAAVLVLLPYQFGMLDYWNMLFLNAAQYSTKVMTPLLLIWLLLPPARGRRTAADGAVLALALALELCAAFSSGVYLPLCGVLPVMLYFGWEWLHRRAKPDRWAALCLGGSAAACGAGLLLGRQVDAVAKGNAMVVNCVDSLTENALKCVAGFFQLFGAVQETEQVVLSLGGVRQIALFCLALLLLWVLGQQVRALGRGGGFGYLTALAVWDLFVLLVCDTRYRSNDFEVRYLLLCAVPLLILLANRLEEMASLEPARLGLAVRVGTGAGMCALMVLTDLFAWKDTRPAALYDTEQRIGAQVAAYVTAMQEPVKTIYIPGQAGVAGCARVADREHAYFAFGAQDGCLKQYDEYLYKLDVTEQQGPSLVLLRSEDKMEALPAYIRGALTWYDTLGDYQLYLAGTLPLDGVVGLPVGEYMLDFPSSPVYTFAGEIDDRHRLHAEGAADVPWVIRSATLPLHCMADISLTVADLQGEGGELELWVGEDKLMTAPLQEGETAFSGVAAGEYILKVSLPEGTSAILGPITFAKSGM